MHKLEKKITGQIFLVVQIVKFVYIFLPGDNTFDANKAINNSQLGQKLYEGSSQGGSFDDYYSQGLPTRIGYIWTVYLSSIYNIYHVTFAFRNGKTNLGIGSFTSSPSNNNNGWTLKSSQRSFILKI